MSGFGYYIYYRVRGEGAAMLESRVRALQTDLVRRTGVIGRLLKKRGEPLLWMEVYENVKDAWHFEGILAELVKSHDLESGLQPDTGRHVECFLEGPARGA